MKFFLIFYLVSAPNVAMNYHGHFHTLRGCQKAGVYISNLFDRDTIDGFDCKLERTKPQDARP